MCVVSLWGKEGFRITHLFLFISFHRILDNIGHFRDQKCTAADKVLLKELEAARVRLVP